jgi:carbon-monoxide dehydrogenase medium subunit
MWDTYLIASSVTDALQKLAALGDRARIIAGGTDLVLQAQRGQCPASAMVDVTRIPGLDRIYVDSDTIVVGATATHHQVAASPVIQQGAPILSRACQCIGGPQIRNVATLVGNVVNALPAADGAVALFALDAEVEVATLEGRACLPIVDLYAGVGACTLDPCVQMVTALRFRPLSPQAGWDFQRLAPRKALALPIVNAAVVAEQTGGRLTNVRIAIGPVAETPFRAEVAERALVGHSPDSAPVLESARLAARDAKPRNSAIRGSQEYRVAMVETLVRRALQNAIEIGNHQASLGSKRCQ